MNAENQFTPGPLHVEKHAGRYEIWPKDKGQNHCYVGVVQRKPDACLFAAAPELLAACQTVLEHLPDAKIEIDGNWDYESAKILRAAIAKATGEKCDS